MFSFLLRRLALTIPTFIALMFVTFVAIRLVPGDPVEVRVGERGISPERLAMFTTTWGWTSRSGSSLPTTSGSCCTGISARLWPPTRRC